MLHEIASDTDTERHARCNDLKPEALKVQQDPHCEPSLIALSSYATSLRLDAPDATQTLVMRSACHARVANVIDTLAQSSDDASLAVARIVMAK